MNKGIFFIPVNDQNKKNDVLLDEIISQTLNAEKWGINEAFFGEHITDKHEKISSSLSMTKPITWGDFLSWNCNFGQSKLNHLLDFVVKELGSIEITSK